MNQLLTCKIVVQMSKMYLLDFGKNYIVIKLAILIGMYLSLFFNSFISKSKSSTLLSNYVQ